MIFLPEFQLYVFHHFNGGDIQDVFMAWGGKACPTGQYCSFFSIPENQGDGMHCYIDIEYFNTTKLEFESNDRIKLTSNLKLNDQTTEISDKKNWETLFARNFEDNLRNLSDAYVLRNTSGRKTSFFGNL